MRPGKPLEPCPNLPLVLLVKAPMNEVNKLDVSDQDPSYRVRLRCQPIRCTLGIRGHRPGHQNWHWLALVAAKAHASRSINRKAMCFCVAAWRRNMFTLIMHEINETLAGAETRQLSLSSCSKHAHVAMPRTCRCSNYLPAMPSAPAPPTRRSTLIAEKGKSYDIPAPWGA